MEKIIFGYSDLLVPDVKNIKKGIWQTDSNGKPLGILAGEYLDVFSYSGNNYLVTRVCDCIGDRKEIIGSIDVRELLVDFYSNGSCDLYIDQEQSEISEGFVKALNHPKINLLLKSGVDLYSVFDYANIDVVLPTVNFKKVFDNDSFCYVVAIKHEIFEEMRECLNNCTDSFYSLKSRKTLQKKKN